MSLPIAIPLLSALQALAQQPSRECTGRGASSYSVAPMAPAEIGVILPLGLMVDAHVTPIYHIYFWRKDPSLGRGAYVVRAPGDGVITRIQHRSAFIGERGGEADEFRITIEHSCTFVANRAGLCMNSYRKGCSYQCPASL